MVFFVTGFSTGGMLAANSLSLMESVPTALSATALGIGDCASHLGQYYSTYHSLLLHL